MFKRIGLLILANFAIFIMLSVILNVISMVTGINFGTMSGKSLNLGALFVFAMVVGFSGSIISLLMSKTMAKMSMGLTMVDVDHPRDAVESYLVSVIRSESEKAGIPMPEVAIYDGEPNAFATGPSKSSSLVAVSTGLLNLMNRDEVEAVLAHEISHVKNGDMVTMTLLQGVMNTFVVFASRVIGWVVDRQILRNEDDAPGVGYYATSFVLDICLGFLASMVVAAFSRYREYHADAGAANIMGTTTPMINALARLGGVAPNELPGSVKGFGISGGIGSLFASHPSIEDRIKALREHRYTAN
ncbi:protease HtpX [Sutterella sp.]|uniref:protease HtpX n=1 Tax=Sutterella sp. TaxID=1981025 RepID=UPI003FD86F70